LAKCNGKVETYSRVCGFFSVVQNWHPGKKSEYAERINFTLPDQQQSSTHPAPADRAQQIAQAANR
jgi:ribonucleoside-triphosphate reductase